jgi:hypothetical protein
MGSADFAVDTTLTLTSKGAMKSLLLSHCSEGRDLLRTAACQRRRSRICHIESTACNATPLLRLLQLTPSVRRYLGRMHVSRYAPTQERFS